MAWRTRGDERGFHWSRSWILGPLAVGLVIAALALLTFGEMKARTSSQDTADGGERTGPASGGVVVDDETPSVAEDLDTLFNTPDLRAVSAAKRLWAGGRTEEVIEMLEDPLTRPSLRTQLLVIASSERSPRISEIARRLLKKDGAEKELRALCRAILEGEEPTGGAP